MGHKAYTVDCQKRFVVDGKTLKGTSAEIIDKLKEINAAVADHNLKARFADLGATAFDGSPADFGKSLLREVAQGSQVTPVLRPTDAAHDGFGSSRVRTWPQFTPHHSVLAALPAPPAPDR